MLLVLLVCLVVSLIEFWWFQWCAHRLGLGPSIGWEVGGLRPFDRQWVEWCRNLIYWEFM